MNKLNTVEYIRNVPGQVGCPYKAIGLGNNHCDWSVVVSMVQIFDLACTYAVAIHILILCMEGMAILLDTLPVKHGEVHPHLDGEVNPHGEVGEQLVIEALHPVSVTAPLWT